MSRCDKYCLGSFLLVSIILVILYYYQLKEIAATSTTNLTWKELLPYFSSMGDPSACRVYYEFGGVLNRKPSMIFLDGQKSVCVDEGVRPDPDDCLVYSFGNNGEWSFDDQMEVYGCQVHTFDPSVWYWNHQHSKNIWFYRLGIGEKDEERDEAHGWRIMTLESIRRILNHTDRLIDYLKMDIEGGEWNILNRWIQDGDLSNVKQLSMELHLQETERMAERYELIRRLESKDSAGFVRFFARENPWSRNDYLEKYNIPDASCYELAWYNSERGGSIIFSQSGYSSPASPPCPTPTCGESDFITIVPIQN